MTHGAMVACRMNDPISLPHLPVLLNEAVEALVQNPGGIYVDATFGRGSHTLAVLKHLDVNGRLIAFDKDPEAVAYARQHMHDQRFNIIHASFSSLKAVLSSMNLFGKISGILFDLGVSSPQLDNPLRGFSFQHDADLDMRMDTTQELSAMSWLAKISEKELADVLWQYGEERFSRRIARAIVAARMEAPITTTTQLADIISKAVPFVPAFKRKKHPATRSFQAIRIVVNQELTELQQGLEQALPALQTGGRLCVISFHSLEDRLVKQFIKGTANNKLPRGLPIKGSLSVSPLKALGKKRPGLKEITANPRARSAILRIAEKII